MITTRATLIALGVLAALVVLVVVLDRQREPGADQQFPPVVAFQPADATRLIVTQDDQTISARQTAAGKWEVEGFRPIPTATPDPDGPPRVVALTPEGRAATIVGQVTSWQVDRVLGPVGDQAAEFGFDRPALKLELQTGRLGTHTLIFGAKTANDASYYVLQQEEDEVVLVSRYDFEAVQRHIEDLFKDKEAATGG